MFSAEILHSKAQLPLCMLNSLKAEQVPVHLPDAIFFLPVPRTGKSWLASNCGQAAENLRSLTVLACLPAVLHQLSHPGAVR